DGPVAATSHPSGAASVRRSAVVGWPCIRTVSPKSPRDGDFGGLQLLANRTSTHRGFAVLRAEGEAQTDHPQPEHEVEPVVGRVEWDEVGGRLLVDEQPVEREQQVDDAAADEEVARSRSRS